MSEETTKTPSAGAVRTAKRIEQAFANGFPRCNQSNIAEIIEQETGAGRLADALDTLTLVVGLTPIAGNKEALQEAVDIARAALAAWKEGA